MTTADETKVKVFEDIWLGGKIVGVFKLHPNGFGWKGKESGRVVATQSADVQNITWLRSNRHCQVRILLKSGSSMKFEGFRESDIEILKDYMRSHHSLDLTEVPMSVKGWNWGETKLHGSTLSFSVDGKQAFELPLNEMGNAGMNGKNEISMEFVMDDTREAHEDSMMEIRLYIPNTIGEDAGKTSAELFEAEIKQKADIGITAGEGIVSFAEMPCLTPRGRYEIEMFPAFMRLHGKTYDYKILYDSLTRLFLLPKPDDQHVLFVIGLDPPIRQGQTRYPFLVLQFLRDEEMDGLRLNLAEEQLNTKYEGKLKPEYSGPSFEVVSTIFKVLTGKKIIVPGLYRTRHGANAIKCTIKANDGYLYPLEKSLLFIPKPPIFIRFAEIGSVEFARYAEGGSGAASSRSFDLKIYTKAGIEHQFSNIPKEEYQHLYDFLVEKNISIRNIVPEKRYTEEYEEESEGDREEEEFKVGRGDDDESEEDEDYAPPSDNDDVREEFDEDYGGSNSDDEEGQVHEKSKKSAEAGGPKKRKKEEEIDYDEEEK